MNMREVIQAIDVGYGNTKFVKRHVYANSIECDLAKISRSAVVKVASAL